MTTFRTSRRLDQPLLPRSPMRQSVRQSVYGDLVGMDGAMRRNRRRSAVLRTVPIFVVTALRAAAAIARGK